jgi:hypothetical protein
MTAAIAMFPNLTDFVRFIAASHLRIRVTRQILHLPNEGKMFFRFFLQTIAVEHALTVVYFRCS